MDKCYSKRRTNPIFFLIIIFIMSVAIDLGTLIHNLPPEQKREVRDLEKVSIRRCKTECSLLFNSICVREHLLPNYSNCYLYIDLTLSFVHIFQATNTSVVGAVCCQTDVDSFSLVAIPGDISLATR